MQLLSFGKWGAAGIAAALILGISNPPRASAQDGAICAGLPPDGNRIDVAIFPSRYLAGEALQYEVNVESFRQNVVTTVPFSERRDAFRFHVFGLDDPLTNGGPTDGVIRSARSDRLGRFPLVDAVAVHRQLRAHGCPADVVMVLIRRLPGDGAPEGIGFTADMLARRGISTAQDAPPAMSARAILEGAFGAVPNVEWAAMERRLVADRTGVGTVVLGEDFVVGIDVALHELGHALASLEDEYEDAGPFGAGSVRLTPCPDEPPAIVGAPERAMLPAVPCAPNLVERTDAETVAAASFPWPVDAGVPLPSTDAMGAPVDGVDGNTVGAFRGGAYSAPGARRAGFGVLRSQLDCRMRSSVSNEVEFCAACRQAIRAEMNARVGAPAAAQPPAPPSPTAVALAWIFGTLSALLAAYIVIGRRSRMRG